MEQHELFEPAQRIEETYRRSLSKLFQEFMRIIEPLALTDPYQVLDMLRGYANTGWFTEMAYAAAARMVTMLKVGNANSWREAASQSSRGRMIFEALKTEMQGPVGDIIRNKIDENARLISSLPYDMAQQANQFILEESQKGRRVSAIAADLIEQFPNVTENRIKLIARTETSKASTALTRARAQVIGRNWYTWQTSRDVRVRDSHKWMGKDGGVVCSFSDDPNPEALSGQGTPYDTYAPGETFNCRCWPRVILDLDDVPWPHRVHHQGQVRTMTRAAFMRVAGVEDENAA